MSKLLVLSTTDTWAPLAAAYIKRQRPDSVCKAVGTHQFYAQAFVERLTEPHQIVLLDSDSLPETTEKGVFGLLKAIFTRGHRLSAICAFDARFWLNVLFNGCKRKKLIQEPVLGGLMGVINTSLAVGSSEQNIVKRASPQETPISGLIHWFGKNPDVLARQLLRRTILEYVGIGSRFARQLDRYQSLSGRPDSPGHPTSLVFDEAIERMARGLAPLSELH